jgi:CBS domain-containing protein
MIVKDIMSSYVITASPEDTFEQIVFIMKSEDVGAVPICDKQNKLLGIITDRDLILRFNSGNTANDLMTKSPIYVNSGDDIHDAAMKFSKYRIRRLPVLDGQRLVGMLSLKDLAKKKVLTAEIGHIIYNICN